MEAVFGRSGLSIPLLCDAPSIIKKLKELATDCKNLQPAVMETNIYDFLEENTRADAEQCALIFGDLKFRLSNPTSGQLRFFEEELGDVRVFFAFAPETEDIWKHRLAEIRPSL
jgi:hypothetical protein